MLMRDVGMNSLSLFITAIQGISDSVVIQAFLVACIGMVLTVIGSLPVLAGIRLGSTIIPYGMGFAAGVMLSASFTSLLIPAIELGGVVPSVIGFMLGALVINIINKAIPHEHIIKGYEGSERLKGKVMTAWLLALAIIIHNIPEGAAVGASTVESLRDGVVLAIAIGIQNVPEGLAVSLPLITSGKGIKLTLLIAVLSGVVEPVSAAVSAALAITSHYILPYMLSFAAGAMIYVVSHEVIPETHAEKREVKATASLMIGVILMLVLDSYYG